MNIEKTFQMRNDSFDGGSTENEERVTFEPKYEKKVKKIGWIC